MRLFLSAVLVMGALLIVPGMCRGAAGLQQEKDQPAAAQGTDLKAGSSAEQPLPVSIIQLIATPDAYHGKFVQIQGFVRIEHEGTAVYLHRDDSEHMLTRNGLWLAVNDSVPEGSREAKVNNRYALITGQFNAQSKGHLGLWSGSIEKISRLEPWHVRKARNQ